MNGNVTGISLDRMPTSVRSALFGVLLLGSVAISAGIATDRGWLISGAEFHDESNRLDGHIRLAENTNERQDAEIDELKRQTGEVRSDVRTIKDTTIRNTAVIEGLADGQDEIKEALRELNRRQPERDGR